MFDKKKLLLFVPWEMFRNASYITRLSKHMFLMVIHLNVFRVSIPFFIFFSCDMLFSINIILVLAIAETVILGIGCLPLLGEMIQFGQVFFHHTSEGFMCACVCVWVFCLFPKSSFIIIIIIIIISLIIIMILTWLPKHTSQDRK